MRVLSASSSITNDTPSLVASSATVTLTNFAVSCRNGLLDEFLYVFVRSLSWQNYHFDVQSGKKDRFHTIVCCSKSPLWSSTHATPCATRHIFGECSLKFIPSLSWEILDFNLEILDNGVPHLDSTKRLQLATAITNSIVLTELGFRQP
eukprot:COSAG06_NODE_13448_length_1256_cov_1.412273_2_plen_149_part_00